MEAAGMSAAKARLEDAMHVVEAFGDLRLVCRRGYRDGADTRAAENRDLRQALLAAHTARLGFVRLSWSVYGGRRLLGVDDVTRLI